MTNNNVLRCIVLVALLLAPLAASQDATAQGSIDVATFPADLNDFSCTVSGEPIGQLFDNGMAQCDPNGTENLFTNAVCTYENILDELLGRLFCGMQYRLLEPLNALMILFITIGGAALALGILPFTTREVVLILFKFGLVYGFATHASLAIDTLYRGLMGFIQDAINITLGSAFDLTLSGTNNEPGLFDIMDQTIADFATKAGESQSADSPCKNGVVSMFLTFIASVPLLAMMGIGMAVQLLMVFFQMILGYFIAITSIMFLIAMTPLFVSFALFNITRSYFDKWAQYLLSFSVQIFVVAAFLGLIISMDLGKDLKELFALARPYSAAQQAEGVRVPIRDWCSICKPQEDGEFGITCEEDTSAYKAPGLNPFTLLSDPNTVSIFGGRLMKILVLAYVLRAVMNAVPGIAHALGGGGAAPMMSGEDMISPTHSTPKRNAHSSNAPKSSAREGAHSMFSFLPTVRK